MKTFAAAHTISLSAAGQDHGVYVRWMSELLLDVRAEHGGLAGLDDDARERFYAEHLNVVDREIAERASWGRTIKWPLDAEELADLASWRSTWGRVQARREKEQTRMAAE